MAAHDRTDPDVVGIGALNVDFVATRSRLSSRDSKTVSEFSRSFESGRERIVSEQEAASLRAHLGDAAFEIRLGGSAFNTIQALRSAAPTLRLGYIGAAGQDQPSLPSFREWFRQNDVEQRFIDFSTTKPSGNCISLMAGGERSLATSRGANDGAARFMRRHKSAIIGSLGRCRCIHLTSFFDKDTPVVLLEILREAKAQNPNLIVSFDPGHQWCAEHSLNPSIIGLLQLTDVLFVNSVEFQLLAGHAPGDADNAAAARLIGKCHDRTMIIFQKNYAAISVFFHIASRGVLRRDFPVSTIAEPDIEDATGAGDVFAAGIIAGRLTPGFQLEDSINLALKMVSKKLTVTGAKTLDIFGGVIGQVADEIAYKHQEKAIFIGHGRDPIWREVESFLRQDLKVNVEAWESDTRLNQFPIEVLSALLDKTRFAILLMTAEDATDIGSVRARQNVLHEMGLFQGRLGFKNVIVLRDVGLEMPTNLEGWQMVEIDRQNIRGTLANLEAGLRSAKII
jgi:sugar/nucleoside kinase (ribokinase family)